MIQRYRETTYICWRIKDKPLDQPFTNIFLKGTLTGDTIRLDTLGAVVNKRPVARGSFVSELWKKIFKKKAPQYGTISGSGFVLIEKIDEPFINAKLSTRSLPVDLVNDGIFFILDSDIKAEGTVYAPAVTGSITIPRDTYIDTDNRRK